MDTKALRQKILDLAIRGKLVPQGPNDEPASVLLERIRAEKQQMVKDGKLKAKDIKNDTVIFVGEDNLHYEKFPDGSVKCIEEEIPFAIPQGWEWCRLSNIALVLNGDRGQNYPAKSKLQAEGIPFVSASNIDNGIVSSKELLCLTENQYEALGAGKLKKDDIVYCIRGSLGKCGIFNFEKGAISSSLVIVRAFLLNTSITNYIFLYLNSYLSENEIKKYDNGSAQPNLAAKDFMRFYFPLPPLSEQHRIVEKLNELFSFVDTIETDKTTLQSLIKQTKSKILDLAIRGKLVPQDPNDEPASVLLERIRAEKEDLIKQGKIKRDKKESVIFRGEDNSYYDIEIPHTWMWTKLNFISYRISDGSHNPPTDKRFGVPLLSAANIVDYDINIKAANRWITETEWLEETTRTQLETNDILLTIVGSIGRTAVVNTDNKFAFQRSVAIIKPCIVYSKYLMYILTAPPISQYLIANSKGTAQKGIYLKQLSDIFIPIPPVAEQIRIVSTIETTFAQLDEIANAIY